ncbi:alpha/beta fold hydrolase [candidate division WWE3 bacterium]|uniref:Alpha/beta fold hydrolase n=1 Tax=candidate division WWE3 bacterium TaxID=2053526 RepID=A0A955RWV7_UNCKA|nr:alpha/beta fold hydrolase [candidate division WWE3 bacterium]
MGIPFEVVQLKTDDKLFIHALYANPERSKGCFVFIHGLVSDVFSSLGRDLADSLYAAGYSTLLLNTRGAGLVRSFDREDKRKASGTRYETIGTAYEVFTESEYDIQAAVDFLKKQKEKNIYLLGHSTGCQKSIHYLSQWGKQKYVKAAILLGPLSDHAVIKRDLGNDYDLTLAYVKKMVKDGSRNELVPKHLFDEFMISSQRLLSLIDPKSKEEVFTYASGRKPKALQSIKTPLLVVLAGEDEYNERPVLALVEWFEEQIAAKKSRVEWVDGADHSFTSKREGLSDLINKWVEQL